MLHSSKRYLLALLLLAYGTQSTWAFSLLGPVPFSAADAFETPIIGYQLTGANNNVVDLGTPKNLAEGYRWNTRNLYYAYDSTFVSYFGSNGMAAVDQAFALYNSLTNFSAYSADLHEIPQNTTRVNYRASALGLVDLKSSVLSVIAEQLGLAQPDRYVWTLHERILPPGAQCPAYNYEVVQRNFDPVTFEYSSYVNGTLYGYNILELCPFNPNPLPPIGAETVPYPVDADQQNVATSVAAGIGVGGTQGGNAVLGTYYKGFSRDDVGGFRYLMGTNSPDSLHLELMPTNTFLVDKTNATQLIQTSDLAAFAQQAQTNAPAQLQALYPSLLINNFTPYFTNVVTTNITVYYLNPPLTNVLLVTNYTTNVLQYYNYTFGNVVTNHFSTTETLSIQTTNNSSNSVSLILVTNQAEQLLVTSDLGLLVAQSYTNPPAALQTLYPDLQIVSNYTSFRLQYITNVTSFFAGSPAAPNLVVLTNVTTNILQYYIYDFANVHTNFSRYSLTEALTIDTNIVTSTASSTTFVTNQQPQILSTMDLGLLIAQSITNSPAAMVALYPGLEILSTRFGFSNMVTTNFISYFTNNPPYAPSGAAFFVVVPVYSTNIVPTYAYTFGNVVTNHYYTQGYVTTTTTNLYSPPYSPVGTLLTQITSNTVVQAYPNGDFYLLPTNSNVVGYQILGLQLVQVFQVPSSQFIATIPAGITNINGQFFSQSVDTYFTNYNYAALAITAISTGAVVTNTTGATYQVDTTSAFNSVSGSYYFAPTLANPNLVDYNILFPLLDTIVTNDTRVTTATNAPGIANPNLNFAIDALTYFTNTTYVVQPITSFASPVQTNTILRTDTIANSISGDFFIAPSNTCGFQVVSNQLATVFTNHNIITIATNAPGVTNNAINFTFDYVTYFTNYTLAVSVPNCTGGAAGIRPGIDKINFFRQDYDSLLSRTWDPINDAYSLDTITNRVHTPQTFRRTVTQPDIVFQAADLIVPGVSFPIVPAFARTTPRFNTALAANTVLAGPGTIEPGGMTITLNKGVPAFLNSFAGTVLDDGSAIEEFLWGSYDASTNEPVVYPSTASITSLENQLFLQITTSGALTNGVVGQPYTAMLTATGSTPPPYQWSLAANSPNLPPGLTGLSHTTNSATGITISGTPTTAGFYDFIAQVTDSAGRLSQRSLLIEIDP